MPRSRCSSSGRATLCAIRIPHPARWSSTAPSACAIPGPRSAAGRRGRWGCWRASVPAENPDQLALDAYPIGRQNAHLVGGVRGLERYGGAAAAEALECSLLLVDQGDHDIAGIGLFGATQQRDITIENTGVDHRIALHLQCKMLARARQ